MVQLKNNVGRRPNPIAGSTGAALGLGPGYRLPVEAHQRLWKVPYRGIPLAGWPYTRTTHGTRMPTASGDHRRDGRSNNLASLYNYKYIQHRGPQTCGPFYLFSYCTPAIECASLTGVCLIGQPMPQDQDVLDIVRDVSRELRFNPSFCQLLHKLDADEAHRITRLYLEWLYAIVRMEQQS
jgi:hypothetical protein